METKTKLIVMATEEFRELLATSLRAILAESSPSARTHAAHEYLSMVEAAEYLKIPQNTLYQYCATRRIPYVKRGKRNYFMRADLDTFIAADRRKSVKEMEADAMERLRKGGKK
jgi:excisionase family DNA binding protein